MFFPLTLRSAEMAEPAKISQRMQVAQQFMIMQEIGQALITAFDVPELVDILAQKLPQAGITSCYLSLP